MSLPITQAAVVVTQSGGPEVMQYVLDHPTPEPEEGYVLIQNEFCGINYVDTYSEAGSMTRPSPKCSVAREAELPWPWDLPPSGGHMT